MRLSRIRELFGDFDYVEDEKHKGLIVIQEDWKQRNIVTITNRWDLRTPGGNPAWIGCHRLVARKIEAALNDLYGQGLIPLITTYDGCFVPRHKCWNPRRTLSAHAWGVALDLNARDYPYRSSKQQHPKILSAFRAHGFKWGGDWKTSDPMHFEIETL